MDIKVARSKLCLIKSKKNHPLPDPQGTIYISKISHKYVLTLTRIFHGFAMNNDDASL